MFSVDPTPTQYLHGDAPFPLNEPRDPTISKALFLEVIRVLRNVRKRTVDALILRYETGIGDEANFEKCAAAWNPRRLRRLREGYNRALLKTIIQAWPNDAPGWCPYCEIWFNQNQRYNHVTEKKHRKRVAMGKPTHADWNAFVDYELSVDGDN